MFKVNYFKVKIVKCSKDDFWYKNKVGQIFNVRDIIDIESDSYEPFDTAGLGGISEAGGLISKQDCEIIEDEKEIYRYTFSRLQKMCYPEHQDTTEVSRFKMKMLSVIIDAKTTNGIYD